MPSDGHGINELKNSKSEKNKGKKTKLPLILIFSLHKETVPFSRAGCIDRGVGGIRRRRRWQRTVHGAGAREGRGAWHATRGAGASGVRRSGRGRAVAGVRWQAAALIRSSSFQISEAGGPLRQSALRTAQSSTDGAPAEVPTAPPKMQAVRESESGDGRPACSRLEGGQR